MIAAADAPTRKPTPAPVTYFNNSGNWTSGTPTGQQIGPGTTVNLVGTITAINGLDFTLNLDSSLFDAFVVPSGNTTQPASIAPYGSRNLEYNNFTKNLPFQSLNNLGN